MARRGSIAYLRRQLAARERELRKLQARQEGLAKKIEAVDRRIAVLTGEAPKRGLKKVAAEKAGRPPKRRGRKTLADYITKALRKSKEGMRARDVAQAVKKSAYPSTSKTFSQMVSATLARDKRFERVSRGVYRLAQ